MDGLRWRPSGTKEKKKKSRPQAGKVRGTSSWLGHLSLGILFCFFWGLDGTLELFNYVVHNIIRRKMKEGRYRKIVKGGGGDSCFCCCDGVTVEK